VYISILILYWFFSEWINIHSSAFIIKYGLWSLLIISLLIEILPSALSPPSLLLLCHNLGVDINWSIAFMTIGSLIGGLISFYIGTKIGTQQLRIFVGNKDISKFQGLFEKYGGIALTIIALTPIPDYPIVFGSLGMSWKNYFIYGFFSRAVGFAIMGYLFVAAGIYLF
jgi:membrane protein YqaA with SNARE-associated domain